MSVSLRCAQSAKSPSLFVRNGVAVDFGTLLSIVQSGVGGVQVRVLALIIFSSLL